MIRYHINLGIHFNVNSSILKLSTNAIIGKLTMTFKDIMEHIYNCVLWITFTLFFWLSNYY